MCWSRRSRSPAAGRRLHPPTSRPRALRLPPSLIPARSTLRLPRRPPFRRSPSSQPPAWTSTSSRWVQQCGRSKGCPAGRRAAGTLWPAASMRQRRGAGAVGVSPPAAALLPPWCQCLPCCLGGCPGVLQARWGPASRPPRRNSWRQLTPRCHRTAPGGCCLSVPCGMNRLHTWRFSWLVPTPDCSWRPAHCSG